MINERVRTLRKELGLTLEKFGKKVGVKKNTLSAIETGRNNVTEQMFKSICREFDVNENWLRNGEGSMFKTVDIENVECNIKERLIGAITVMSNDEATRLWNYIKSLHEEVLL